MNEETFDIGAQVYVVSDSEFSELNPNKFPSPMISITNKGVISHIIRRDDALDDEDDKLYLVEFELPIRYGHDGLVDEYKGRAGYCWWCTVDDLILADRR